MLAWSPGEEPDPSTAPTIELDEGVTSGGIHCSRDELLLWWHSNSTGDLNVRTIDPTTLEVASDASFAGYRIINDFLSNPDPVLLLRSMDTGAEAIVALSRSDGGWVEVDSWEYPAIGTPIAQIVELKAGFAETSLLRAAYVTEPGQKTSAPRIYGSVSG